MDSNKKNKEIVVKIDPQKVLALSEDASALVFQPEAEEALIKLMKMQESIDKALDMVKDAIAESGEQIMEGFSGVESSKLRVMNRKYGSKYTFVKGVKCPEEFVKTSERSSVDSSAVDDYIQEHGELPVGVKKANREKSLSITMKK